MKIIRAHFDGRMIVPDEPLELPPQSQVMVMIDDEHAAADAALEQATREYYQRQSAAERAEDEEWARITAADARRAWE